MTVTDPAHIWRARLLARTLKEDPWDRTTWVLDELYYAAQVAILHPFAVPTAIPTNGEEDEDDALSPLYPPFQPLLSAADNPPQWIATDFLLANEYTLIAGEGASYKTTVLLAILAAVAGGYPVLNGFPVGAPASVLLGSGEDAIGVLKNRLQAMIQGQGWDPAPIAANLHALALEDAIISSMGWQHHLEEAAQDYHAVILGLDPLADLIDFDENDNSKARPVIQWFRRLGRLGIAPLLCHHYGKATEHKQGMQRIRGATAWMNAARAIYTVETKDGSQWLGCGKLSRAERPAGRELRIQIESQPENRAIWKQATVELAHRPQAAWMVADQRELTPAERRALQGLDAFADESLSWTRWKEAAGMEGSSLTMAQKRLLGLHYVQRNNAGVRFGRAQFTYQISPEGRNALLDASLRQCDANATPMAWSHTTPTTPMPPIGGHGSGVVALPIATEIATYFGNGPIGVVELGPGSDPSYEPPDLSTNEDEPEPASD